ncbi:MAG TPA: hypothetical protein VN776_09625 [Terracidiphilus sp.]|nr:hypothetical protein [Terracidiphilus sp.]
MERLWCWRCKIEVPMLDEDEYAEVAQLYSGGMSATKEFRERWHIPLKDATREDRFRPLRDAYERLTGMKESNHLAIMHHRLTLYGPPCKRCQKPLRTPRAKLCGSCMFPVDGGDSGEAASQVGGKGHF